MLGDCDYGICGTLFGEEDAEDMLAAGMDKVRMAELHVELIKKVLNRFYYRHGFCERKVIKCSVLTNLGLKGDELLNRQAKDSGVNEMDKRIQINRVALGRASKIARVLEGKEKRYW